MNIRRTYIGGWFQRTTLHLSELWDFFNYRKSELNFRQADIDAQVAALDIAELTRESGPLEYIRARTRGGVEFRIYEDGLMVLEAPFTELAADFARIRAYYDEKLAKAISFIFSKGAPNPKELADIKTILPYIVLCDGATPEDVTRLFADLNEDRYSSLAADGVEVHRSGGVILLNNLNDEDLAREIIESQIFFREFKSQLHRYLAIHRTVWESIAAIKERGSIRGTELDAYQNELAAYQKTIDLIDARIAQMGSYLRTRQKLTDTTRIGAFLNPLFQYRFETLADTHEYIQHLWKMTRNYLASASEAFAALQAKSTKSTISSLQLVTTLGVVAGMVGYLGKDALPPVTAIGLAYFALLLGLTWALNAAVSRIYRNKGYSFKGVDIRKDIH